MGRPSSTRREPASIPLRGLAPAIDPGIDEALRYYIERKKASIPDAAY